MCVGNPTGSSLSLTSHIVGAPWRPEPSSQGFLVWGDYLHGIHAVKINMNSSGPSLCGSQREAGFPSPVSVLGKNKRFPVSLTPPHWLLQPAGMEGGRERQAQSSELSCQSEPRPPSLLPSPMSASRQVNGLQGPAGSSGWFEEGRLEWWPLAWVLSQVLCLFVTSIHCPSLRILRADGKWAIPGHIKTPRELCA